MWLECIILRVASARFSRSTRFCRMVAGYFRVAFPFLFGGTFIEALAGGQALSAGFEFPFLFGGTFIEAPRTIAQIAYGEVVSLPFRRDFH